MILKKTLLAISCSVILTACGGGGGGSSSSGGTSDNGGSNGETANPSNPATDLEKAKVLIKTTNNIIAYFDSFKGLQSQYEPAFDAVSNAGNDISNASDLIITLASLAQKDAQGSTKDYTAAELEALLEDDATYGGIYYPDYILSKNGLKISVTPTSVSVNGSVSAKYWMDYIWDSSTFTGKDVFSDAVLITVSNLKLDAPFTASAKQHDFKIVSGGKITAKNADGLESSLGFNSNSTAQVVYDTAIKLEDSESENAPVTAQFKFLNVLLTTQNAKLNLTELSSKAARVKFKNGTETFNQIIPYEIILKGEALSGAENLGLDANIKLKNDLTKTFDITQGESAAAFINADLTVNLSGNVKGGGAAVKPFSLLLNAKRNDYQKGIANLKVTVDQNTLNIDVKTDNLIAQSPIIWSRVSHANGAFVEIPDLDQFSSADIKVGTVSYGRINRVSNSIYSAKFTDNTVLMIAP